MTNRIEDNRLSYIVIQDKGKDPKDLHSQQVDVGSQKIVVVHGTEPPSGQNPARVTIVSYVAKISGKLPGN